MSELSEAEKAAMAWVDGCPDEDKGRNSGAWEADVLAALVRRQQEELKEIRQAARDLLQDASEGSAKGRAIDLIPRATELRLRNLLFPRQPQEGRK